MKKILLIGAIIVILILPLLQWREEPITDIELIAKTKRHEYYGTELGKLYKNRFGLYYFNDIQPDINKYLEKMAPIFAFETYLPFL